MSNYVKATNFAAKDALSTGNANKVVKGTEIDTEFNGISSAVASKADINSPALTGVPTTPTATVGTNTTQVASTAFVKGAVDALSLGTMSIQNKTAVDITGGTIVGITDLAVADGGTGQSSYTNGQLLIGNTTGNTLTKATLTAGSGVTITNGNGSITIAAEGGGGGSGTVTSVATGNGLSGGPITSTGTLIIAAPSANSIGSYAFVSIDLFNMGGTNATTFGNNFAAGTGPGQVRLYGEIINGTSPSVGTTGLSGTWKWMAATCGASGEGAYAVGLAVRVS